MLTLRKAILYTLAWFTMIINTSCSVGHHHQTSKKHADPVCENSVDVNAALLYSNNDEMYYFNSEECLQVFKKNPEKFSMALGGRPGLFRGK
ncbi:YHS domain-containing protein [Cyclobacterium marinum DSM 745]|jgi:YHS domain-containing protein|uniref:YHS domain-containing protein n=2 Tax=Cyclobacterium marinum TaxID=104 RepID=G0J1Q3_CYCMS|nr:YHS domain-containing protein [Cyclobacterium marinum DSM 745]|tara:strand:+ start:4829 stop:5104 length:276 start_codon:yes stop_codon:yes gene_type:complete